MTQLGKVEKNTMQGTHRITATIDETQYQRVLFWAEANHLSVNEFLKESIDFYIKRQNGDYDLPTLEIARLNQVVGVVATLSANVQSLEDITTRGFGSLLGLTRGNNYLLQDEDGEL